jgi:predicted nuclease of restriction endonuclease-like (RecB) superfamily
MRKFYEQWSMLDKSTITNVETTNTKSTIAIVDLPDAIESIDIYHSLSFPDTVSFPVEDFLHTPFTHHIRIIEKIDNINERYYYIHRCANEYLSVEALKRLFKEDAYHNQQQIPNNFTTAKISAKEARKAVMMFKDEYTLDFINVEEIGERDNEDIDERVVEQQIVQNIKRFIMTFGNDFAFIGNQYHLEVYGVEHFSDLLFFNRELNAMVCVELKVGAFKPSYLGQLTAYLRILDDHVKKSHENPSIGIVLCKSAKREYVEYIIQDFDKPMGVATYTTAVDMPEDLRKALPDMDELKKLL